MEKDPYETYQRLCEPDKEYKSYVWGTAMGLQKVDGLETSEYLRKLANENIEGHNTYDEIEEDLKQYYKAKKDCGEVDDSRTDEADLVSTRIARILSIDSFSLKAETLLRYHRELFEGIYPHAGRIRNYDISKKEWILNGDSVFYENCDEINAALEYEINEELKCKYDYSDIDGVIRHIATFISRLWQVHPFCEGNTRTIAVFLIMFLKSKRFDVTNDLFENNAFYFRNALVRANYENYKLNVTETNVYLELFLKNLLLGENNQLNSEDLRIPASK